MPFGIGARVLLRPTALTAAARCSSFSNLAFATQLAQSFTRASPRSARYLLIEYGLRGLREPLS